MEGGPFLGVGGDEGHESRFVFASRAAGVCLCHGFILPFLP